MTARARNLKRLAVPVLLISLVRCALVTSPDERLDTSLTLVLEVADGDEFVVWETIEVRISQVGAQDQTSTQAIVRGQADYEFGFNVADAEMTVRASLLNGSGDPLATGTIMTLPQAQLTVAPEPIVPILSVTLDKESVDPDAPGVLLIRNRGIGVLTWGATAVTSGNQCPIEGIAQSCVELSSTSGELTSGQTDVVTVELIAGDLGQYDLQVTSAEGSIQAPVVVKEPPVASIIVAVDFKGVPVQGESVTVSGPVTRTDTSGAGGGVIFAELPLGSYEVTTGSGGEPASALLLRNGASISVIVSLGEAQIRGALFLDENLKDGVRTAGAEDNLQVANVAIVMEGPLPGEFTTVQTDANGAYTLSDLSPGSYRISLDAADPNIPSMVSFSAIDLNPKVISIRAGETAIADFAFDIIRQTVTASGFLGVDGAYPGVTPIKGWSINLYDTNANALAGGVPGRLGSVVTGADGTAFFRFLRSADVGPSSASTDHVVFAQVAVGTPTETHTINGETVIEVPYDPRDSLVAAPDTFDALYNAVTLGINGQEIDGDPLAAWTMQLRANKDTTVTPVMTGTLDAAGFTYFDLTPANLAATSDGVLPDTLYLRLNLTQAAANGHGFTQSPTPGEGTQIQNGLVKFIWDGTTGPGDTIWIGTETVTYTDVDVLLGIHQEKDDSTDIATYTKGDAIGSVEGAARLQLYNTTTGNAVSAGAAAAPGSGGAPYKVNELLYTNLAVASTWQVRARSTEPGLDVLNDITFDFTLTGDDQIDSIGALIGSAGPSAFAMKANNTMLTGTILSTDGVTPVVGMRVNIVATSDNIQPNRRGTDSTQVKTNAAGVFTLTGMREGPYTVTVQDSSGVWAFTDTLKKVVQDGNVVGDGALPVAGTDGIGTLVANTDAVSGVRDNQGVGSTSVANFVAYRMDTKIEGLVANDRDSDFNTLDPDEALSGVAITLIDDADGDGTIDAGEATVGTTTTDSAGAYAFSGLKEDNYIVSAASPTSATVLRALSATGLVTSTATVITTAVSGAGATLNQNGTNQVGDVNPPGQNDEFPRWNYLTGTAAADGGALGAGAGPNFLNTALTTTPTHFVHLFNTGTVTGRVEAADSSGVAGVRVTLTLCATAPALVSPPAAGACTTKHSVPSPHVQNFDTDAGGDYTFSGLLEGVYQIDVAPATAGFTTIVVPAAGSYLATTVGNNDIETAPAFVIS